MFLSCDADTHPEIHKLTGRAHYFVEELLGGGREVTELNCFEPHTPYHGFRELKKPSSVWL
jgi:hypothetical protein